MCEWKACEVCNNVLLIPARCSVALTLSIASSGPDTTQDAGLFSPATHTVSSRRRLTSCLGACTDNIEPLGMDCIKRPRAATRDRASLRRKTPDRHAATYSPML